MKIAVIGGGAIGLLFTAYLTEVGQDVTLFVRRNAQKDLILNNGVTLSTNQETHCLPKTAVLQKSLYGFELIVVAVKQHHLENILPSLRESDSGTTLLFIQNGMAHIDQLKQLHNDHILLGIVEHGATKQNDFSVAHKGIGITKIAAIRGNEKVIEQLPTMESFPFSLYHDWYEISVEKLLINHAINPLTAIFKVTNGELVKNKFYNQLMRRIYDEAMTIFELDNSEIIWEKIISICDSTALNRSSMLQDIEHMRPTEIQAISGYVLSYARRLGKPCPMTEFLILSIKGLERSSGERGD